VFWQFCDFSPEILISVRSALCTVQPCKWYLKNKLIAIKLCIWRVLTFSLGIFNPNYTCSIFACNFWVKINLDTLQECKYSGLGGSCIQQRLLNFVNESRSCDSLDVVSSVKVRTANEGSSTLDRKHIYANPSSYPNPDPNAQLCFWTNEMTSFFDQVYRYRLWVFAT